MKKIILLVALAMATVFMSNAAEARVHKKKHHHSIVKVHHKKVNKVAVVAQPVIVYSDDTNSSFFQQERQRNATTTAPTKKQITKVINENTDLINRAARYIGYNSSQLGLPSRLWCADFMNMLVGGSDRRAVSYLNRGSTANYGCVNCVAVTSRRGGAHVGIVEGYDSKGNPIIISGNHGRRVGIGTYARNRVIAYRYIS